MIYSPFVIEENIKFIIEKQLKVNLVVVETK